MKLRTKAPAGLAGRPIGYGAGPNEVKPGFALHIAYRATILPVRQVGADHQCVGCPAAVLACRGDRVTSQARHRHHSLIETGGPAGREAARRRRRTGGVVGWLGADCWSGSAASVLDPASPDAAGEGSVERSGVSAGTYPLSC